MEKFDIKKVCQIKFKYVCWLIETDDKTVRMFHQKWHCSKTLGLTFSSTSIFEYDVIVNLFY